MTTHGRRHAYLALGTCAGVGMISLLSAFSSGCSEKRSVFSIAPLTSDSGDRSESVQLGEGQDAPGLTIKVVKVSGATGSNATTGTGSPSVSAFRVGDRVALTFTVKRADGTDLPLALLDHGEVFLSGPSFNYQRVFGSTEDLIARSVKNGDGSYTYTFPPLPAKYAAPPNFKDRFTDGVLKDQDLLSGTYTFAISAFKKYVRGTEAVKDVANVTGDILFGTATTIQHREVVTQQSCEQCHENLQHHAIGGPGGGTKTLVSQCVLCHVAGAEDWNGDDATLRSPNDPTAPKNQTIEFKVMVHKIHGGKRLPSVNGIGVDGVGNRDYSKRPDDYRLITQDLQVKSFSEVQFPVFLPWFNAMPRRAGYTALGSTVNPYDGISYQTHDANVRGGVISCEKCHGVPSSVAAGFASDFAKRDATIYKYPAPAQGELAFKQPSRRVCGSCHDDIDFTKPYTINGFTHSPTLEFATDSKCIECHVGSTKYPQADVVTAHTHPLKRKSVMPVAGVNWETLEPRIISSTGAVVSQLKAGCKLEVRFAVRDDNGNDLSLATLFSGTTTTFPLVMNGPTGNRNVVNYVNVPWNHSSLASVTSSYAVFMPAINHLEFVGNAGGTIAVTSNAPHWQKYSNLTPTYVAEGNYGTASACTLSVTAYPMQNYIDVATPYSGTFANKDYICIDRGTATEEWLRITLVEAKTGFTRFFFTSPYSFNAIGQSAFANLYGPWVRKQHNANASVSKVTVTAKTQGTGYTLDTDTGLVTPVVNGTGTTFTSGRAVLVSYTADWSFQSTGWYYPPALNDSPDMDDSCGKWAGKSVVSGTYTIGIWSRVNWTYAANGETQNYSILSSTKHRDFIVNTGTPGLPYVPTDKPLSPTGSQYLTLEPYGVISNPERNCGQCHDQLMFHGGSRWNASTCFLCHATAGAEDKARYIGVVVNNAPNSPATPQTLVKFSNMLHKIHMGEELQNGHTYQVVGNSPTLPSMYDEIVFPANPRGVRHCDKCHGLPDPKREQQVWDVPTDKTYPFPLGANPATTGPRDRQINPNDRYTWVCNSCHDSNDASAHMSLMSTTGGTESCYTCHGGPGATYFTGTVHQNQKKKN